VPASHNGPPLDAYKNARGDDAERWRAHALALLDVLEIRARDLPPQLLEQVPDVVGMWRQGTVDAARLTDVRVACWQFLEAKHGTSTAITDDEDRAVRLLVCACFAEGTADDAVETDWFLASLLTD
jgi:hypothetical protein